jgi:hypothetical protein
VFSLRGHDVRVLTGYPHYPQWKRDEASSGFRSEEEIDGVCVRRLSHHVPPDLTWVGRAAMELTFGLQLLTTRWGGPEVVVCVTPPLLAVAMSAVRARLTWRRPGVGILVHDLYSRGVAETAAVSGLPARAGVCARRSAGPVVERGAPAGHRSRPGRAAGRGGSALLRRAAVGGGGFGSLRSVDH